jgi:ribosomal-protein-alanine N-acetyltransferase
MQNISFNSQRFFSRFPILDLGDIKLRELMLSDAELYLKMMSDPEVTQYLSDEDVPRTLEETYHEIKFWGSLFHRRHSIFWALAEKETDKFIGTIGFNNWNINNRRAEISYDLSRDYWRKGVMTKALNNVLMFAFNNMNVHRVEARTMLGNEASKRLLEKVEFKHEGILRGYRVIKEEPVDVHLYAVLKTDVLLLTNN